MWPFKKRTARVDNATASDLFDVLRQYKKDIELLREDHETLKAQHLKLRGRVYAQFGKGVDDNADQPLDLNDPRLTKDQLRAALLPHGKRFKHRDN